MSVRRTKIVATLGPASNSPEVLEQLILAGLDVARLNFSHGTPDEHKARAKLVRDLAAKHGRFVALLGDLQGPKIRIAKFAGKKIELIIRDTKGAAPDLAKRFAQELITRDQVQFLAGFGLTPNAMAVAPVAPVVGSLAPVAG